MKYVSNENQTIALFGTISGHVPIKYICQFHKPRLIMLWEFDGISKEVYEWSKESGVKIKQFYPHPCSSEERDECIRSIVREADIIYVFHDWEPSYWTPWENNNNEGLPLDYEANFAKNYANSIGKEVDDVKIEKIFHHRFGIFEDDERGFHSFDIEIPYSSGRIASTRGNAIAKAQLYFMTYIMDPIRIRHHYNYSLHIEGKTRWHKIDTRKISRWFDEISKYYSENEV